jgi:hypothetical protein
MGSGGSARMGRCSPQEMMLLKKEIGLRRLRYTPVFTTQYTWKKKNKLVSITL